MSKYKVCFMGTPKLAQTVLEALVTSGEYDVVLCCCQPDKPVGRKKIITPPPTKVYTTSLDIECFHPDSMRTDEAYEKIKACEPDLIITAAYGKILPQRILDIPRLGPVNVHASLLPKYRGAAPVQFAIMDGEEKTGVTIMEMDAGMDTGAIIDMEEVAIDKDITTEGLMDILAEVGGRLLLKTLPRYINGELKAVPQDEAASTTCTMIRSEMGLIDWSKSAREVHDKIRALTEWPGAFTYLDGGKLKIYASGVFKGELPAEAENAEIGSIVKAHKKDLVVKCGEGYVAIKELQVPGGKRLAAVDCAHNFKTGTLLGVSGEQ